MPRARAMTSTSTSSTPRPRGWRQSAPQLASRTWPEANVGIGEQLNTGVASYISQSSSAGAIGFVEYGYALQNGFVNAAVKNSAGSYVAPSEASIAAAGAQATSLSATDFNVVNEPGAGTYPSPTSAGPWSTRSNPTRATGIALGKLFDWVVTTGQGRRRRARLRPLPANVASLAHSTILELDELGRHTALRQLSGANR